MRRGTINTVELIEHLTRNLVLSKYLSNEIQPIQKTMNSKEKISRESFWTVLGLLLPYAFFSVAYSPLGI